MTHLNTYLLGDRVEVMNSLPAESVHLIVTSPPYNVGKTYDVNSDNLETVDYLTFLRDTWVACERLLVDGGRIVINLPSICQDGKYTPVFADVIQQMREIGLTPRDTIVWDKNHVKKRTSWGSYQSPSAPRCVYMYEFILVFHKGGGVLSGEKQGIDITAKEFINYTDATWRIPPETKDKNHPAPFPREIPYRAMKFYSYKYNTVLDPFAGSGTVGVVAKYLKRNYILIDNSEKYAQQARKDLSQREMF